MVGIIAAQELNLLRFVIQKFSIKAKGNEWYIRLWQHTPYCIISLQWRNGASPLRFRLRSRPGKGMREPRAIRDRCFQAYSNPRSLIPNRSSCYESSNHEIG